MRHNVQRIKMPSLSPLYFIKIHSVILKIFLIYGHIDKWGYTDSKIKYENEKINFQILFINCIVVCHLGKILQLKKI